MKRPLARGGLVEVVCRHAVGMLANKVCSTSSHDMSCGAIDKLQSWILSVLAHTSRGAALGGSPAENDLVLLLPKGPRCLILLHHYYYFMMMMIIITTTTTATTTSTFPPAAAAARIRTRTSTRATDRATARARAPTPFCCYFSSAAATTYYNCYYSQR